MLFLQGELYSFVIMSIVSIESKDLWALIALCRDHQLDATAHRSLLITAEHMLPPGTGFYVAEQYEQAREEVRSTVFAQYAELEEAVLQDKPLQPALRRFLDK